MVRPVTLSSEQRASWLWRKGRRDHKKERERIEFYESKGQPLVAAHCALQGIAI